MRSTGGKDKASKRGLSRGERKEKGKRAGERREERDGREKMNKEEK